MEGFFARVFRSGLQPVEVGRRIQREMGQNKTISVSRTYAPNDFRIFISQEDHQRFAAMEEGLISEFSDVIIDTAKENRWNLMGQPRVRFIEDDDLGKGQFKVESSLAADKGSPVPAMSTREPDEANPGATRALSLSTAERLGVSKSGAELVELDDSGEPRESISITRTPIVVGRLSSVDVVLSDPNVSRRHAEIRRDGPAWVLVDLGSTNGTYVNGRQVSEHSLDDGDRLSFGSSEMLFKLTVPADPNATQVRSP